MTYLETGVYRLSTLSPVHIRAGEPRLYGQGFIRLNDTDDFLYVVDPLKLQSEIFALGLDAVNTYTEVFSDLQPKMNIAQVLKRIGYDYRSNIEKISNGIVRLPSGNRFMRSGLEQHFIPGSSIKGAIKTAVLYDNVKQRIAEGRLDLDDFVESQITKYLAIRHLNRRRQRSMRENFKRQFAKSLLENAFQSLHPKERSPNRRRREERDGQFKDIFRAIKVKDAMIEETSIDLNRFAEVITHPNSQGATLKSLAGNEIQLPIHKIITNLKRGDWIEIDTFEEKDGDQTVSPYVKVDEPTFSRVKFEDILFTTLSGKQIVEKNVGKNTRFECFSGRIPIEISIDREILESFTRADAKLPFSDIDSLMNLCQNFAQAQWDDEQKFLTNHTSSGSINLDKIDVFYTDSKNKNGATLRIGWGTGMLGTTVTLLLDELTRVKLRNEVISVDRRDRPQPAPKSRRFVLENGQPVSPLGWIELKRE